MERWGSWPTGLVARGRRVQLEGGDGRCVGTEGKIRGLGTGRRGERWSYAKDA